MADNADTSGQSARGVGAALSHLTHNKTEAALLLTRALTLFFTVAYLVPVFGVSSAAAYQKALMASAATSALRLHQRLPAFRLSRDFLALLVVEDSAHYLLFALLFAANAPLTLALLPIALFAFLHFCAQSLALVDRCGQRGAMGGALSSVVESYQRSILQTVALTEIMLMPAVVFAVVSGVVSIVAPFLYYRFVALRYASRRNPYSRQMFHELRLSVQHLLYRPLCPQMVRNAGLSAIGLVERLAPPVASN